MLIELVGLLAHFAYQHLKIHAITQLGKKPNKELKIAGLVYEVSARSLKLWLPNLYGHGFGEDLLS